MQPELSKHRKVMVNSSRVEYLLSEETVMHSAHCSLCEQTQLSVKDFYVDHTAHFLLVNFKRLEKQTNVQQTCFELKQHIFDDGCRVWDFGLGLVCMISLYLLKVRRTCARTCYLSINERCERSGDSCVSSVTRWLARQGHTLSVWLVFDGTFQHK